MDSEYCESANNSLSPSKKREKARVSLHEAIHKLANRNGFLTENNERFVGLIEGGTEKICEDKYGDKTSYTESIGKKSVQFNFSKETTYKLQQVIYRQMAQLVQPGLADRCTIRGGCEFFNEFANLYGEDLFLYVNHRANRLLKDRLPSKQKLKYLKQAQDTILEKAFDKKLLDVQTEEDMICYMNELRDFESVTVRIEDDSTFQEYYDSKYDYIIQLAQQKGIDLSKLEQLKYCPVDFYPVRNFDRIEHSEITQMHVQNLLDIEECDLSKCTRMQIQQSGHFYQLDMVLQEGIPISIVENNFSYDVNCLEEEELISFYKSKLGINHEVSKIYNITTDVYMVTKAGKVQEIYFYSFEEDKTYSLTGNQIDLDISSDDIEMAKNNEIDSEYMEDYSLFDKFKNLFKNIFLEGKIKHYQSLAKSCLVMIRVKMIGNHLQNRLMQIIQFMTIVQ